MNRVEPLPEDIDQVGELPMPREQTRVVGHGPAEAQFVDALAQGRLHHAWLLAGPAGIGKATFAFRVARFLLAHGDLARAQAAAERSGLAVPPEHTVSRQVAQLAHPDLFLLRRSFNKDKKLRGESVVDDVRAMNRLFEHTAGGAGWRVAVIDPADDLNRAAENALLKRLEEPPPRTLFLLVTHNPAGLLPTVRSRCRRLDLRPLPLSDVAAVVDGLLPDAEPDRREQALRRADGRPRRALELLADDSLELLVATEALLEALPRPDLSAAHALADRLAHKGGGEAALALFRDTLAAWVAARIREGVAAGEDTGALARLAEAFAAVVEQHGAAGVYNLDRKQLVLRSLADLSAALAARRAA